MNKLFLLSVAAIWLSAGIVNGQHITIKTNLLYGGAALTPNAGVEFRLSDRWSLDLSGGYNPWTFNDGKKLKHWLVQPEARYWLKRTFDGHFLGLHALGGAYNINRIRLPWKFDAASSRYRYEGRAVGIGIGYGYSWRLGRRWHLEAEAGIGYIRLDYDRYRCNRCSALLEKHGRDVVRPTKLAVSLVYSIGKKRARKTAPPVSVPAPPPTAAQAAPPILAPTVRQESRPAEPPTIRTVRDTLIFRFGTGRAGLDPAENTAAFASLDSLLRRDIRIGRITLVGYASPEGSETLNLRLGRARAEAVKAYLKNCRPELSLPDSLFTLRCEGEDRKGLIAAIRDGGDARQRELLLGILQEQDPALRKQRMLQYGSLLRPFYPALRRTVCIIEHTTK